MLSNSVDVSEAIFEAVLDTLDVINYYNANSLSGVSLDISKIFFADFLRIYTPLHGIMCWIKHGSLEC